MPRSICRRLKSVINLVLEVVVGDAAHTCTPQMASGAGIAIEDTIVLTELLQSDGPLPDVLEKFMAPAVRTLLPGC